MGSVEVVQRQATQGIYSTVICSLDKWKSSVFSVVGFSSVEPNMLYWLLAYSSAAAYAYQDHFTNC